MFFQFYSYRWFSTNKENSNIGFLRALLIQNPKKNEALGKVLRFLIIY